MIVDTMTDEEIVKICNKEYEDEVKYHTANILFDNRYARFINKNLKAEQEHCFKTIKHVTKAGNVFYLIPKTRGKREFKKKGIVVIEIMIYRRNNLLYAISRLGYFNVSSRGKILRYKVVNYVFTPHFFDRYRERYLKNQEIPKLDTILEFFRNTSGTNGIDLSNSNNKGSIFIAVKDGIVLGSAKENNIIECKTFVSNEMLKNDQIDEHEHLSKLAKKPCCYGKLGKYF